jgi:hypothetical protein
VVPHEVALVERDGHPPREAVIALERVMRERKMLMAYGRCS